MSGGFKFHFAPSADAEGGVDSANSRPGARSGLIADANEVIAKLVERSKRNSSACTLVNASSKILSYNDSIDEEAEETGDFKPKLRFHPHESIDLLSSKTKRLRYVEPKHTISDSTTDLIPGVYEGGLKVWECSVDLCRFLAHVIDDLSVESASSLPSDDGLGALHTAVRRSLGPGGSTMELGCGHGLPGCLILRENILRENILGSFGPNTFSDETTSCNKSVVIFADFNDFVLHNATIPNAQLNVGGLRRKDGVAMDEHETAQSLLERSIFVGGDWMGLSHQLSSGKLLSPVQSERLDLILASETTYTPESCQDTAFLMLSHLKIDYGIGLVATKRFYFGVGGGTDLFIAACKTLSLSDQGICSDLRLCVRSIQSYDTGNANIRDLLEVRCQRK